MLNTEKAIIDSITRDREVLKIIGGLQDNVRLLKEIIDQYKTAASIQIDDVSSPLNQGMFYLESQLEEFIIEN